MQFPGMVLFDYSLIIFNINKQRFVIMLDRFLLGNKETT